ncbi:hypothetical protein [Natronobiforma cellulositropha]|uniref:hypothetical protein n=1 Tax=Natronobiforma cellulositropha TaxID=1679076 RepID=UPI0021D5F3F0|nr:hypothetical protein [Natronobiforma cellulositropha]
MVRGDSAANRRTDEGSNGPSSLSGENRRTFLRAVVGTGLVGTGLASALPSAAADTPSWEPETYNVDSYDFATSSFGTGSPIGPEGPTDIHFEDDAVVIDTGYTFPHTGCDTFVLSKLAYDEGLDRLGVVVDHIGTWEYYGEDEDEWVCADAHSTVRYELSVPFEEGPPESVVLFETIEDETYTTTEYREPPLEVPDGVEYELTLGNFADSYTEAEDDPAVTVDGDEVVVEGILSLTGCLTVGLERLAYAEDEPGHLEIEVVDTYGEDYLPGSACPAVHFGQHYELVVTANEPLEAVTVTESDSVGERVVTVSGEADEFDPWIHNIEDYEFTVDSHGGTSGSPVAVDFDGGEVVVTGAHRFGQTGCDTFVLERLGYDEHSARLGVVVEHVPAWELEGEDPWDCGDAISVVEYELSAAVDGPVDSVAVVERVDGEDAHSIHRRDPPEFPAFVTDYELTVGEFASFEAAEADPEAVLDGEQLVAEGAVVIGSSSCKTVGVGGVDYDEEADHLEIEIVDAYRETYVPPTGCTDDVSTREYALSVRFEEVPSTITVAERDLYLEDRSTAVSSEDLTIAGNTPQDLTGDGLYEDVTGDGQLGFNDVVTFFEEHDSDAVQGNVDRFDFSGNGRVGFDDVIALFERL